MSWQGNSGSESDPGGAGRPQSWKRPGKSAEVGGGRRWTERRESTGQGGQFRRFARIFVYLVALLLLTGLLVRYLLFRPVSVPLLAAAVTQYGQRVPPNALAAEDITSLMRMSDGYDNISFHGPGRPIDNATQLLGWLERQIAEVHPGGPQKNALIIYLNGHGVVNDRGQPCLLMPGQPISRSSEWMPIETLLTAITEARPSKSRVLLILDTHRLDREWSLGILYQQFADRLIRLIQQKNLPDLWVLCAAGPGQSSRTAPVWGESVFGHFLANGLRGAADRGASADDQVSLAELFDYVRSQVTGWCQRQGGAVQEPILVPQLSSTQQVPLTFVSGVTERESKPVTPNVQDEVLNAAWLRHAELVERLAFSTDPMSWAELEQQLLRLEQLQWAGTAYRKQAAESADRIDALCSRLERQRTPRPVSHPSVALSTIWDTFSPRQIAAAEQQLTQWLSEQAKAKKPPAAPAAATGSNGEGPATNPVAPAADGRPADGSAQNPSKTTAASPAPATTTSANAAPPDEGPADAGPAGTAAARTPASGEQPDTTSPGAGTASVPPGTSSGAAVAPDLPSALAARTVLNWWRRQPSALDQGRMAAGLKFCALADTSAVKDTVETHLAWMIQQHLDWSQAGLGPRAATALTVRQLTEQLSVPADIRSIYWTRRMLTGIDSEVRLAEDRLFIADARALQQVDAAWTRLVGGSTTATNEVGRAGGLLGQCAAQQAELRRAYAVRDRSWAVEPWLAQWVLGRLRWKEEAGMATQIDALIEQTHQLGVALDQLPVAGGPTLELDAITSRRKAAEQTLNVLLNAIADRARFFLDLQAGQVRRHLVELQLLLQSPLVTGRDRIELRSLARLKQSASVGDQPDGSKTLVTAADDTDYVRQLASRATHPALAILDTRSLELEADDADAEQEAGSATPAVVGGDERAVALAVLLQWEQRVRRLQLNVGSTVETLVEQTTQQLQSSPPLDPLTVRQPVSRGDRLLRAAAAVLHYRPWSGDGIDPTEYLHDVDWFFWLLWQAERRMDDFWGPGPAGQEDFFALSARELIDRAAVLVPAGRPHRQAADGTLLGRTQLAEQGLPLTATPLWRTPGESEAEHTVSVSASAVWPGGEAALWLRLPGESGQAFPWLTLERQPLGRVAVPVGPGSAAMEHKHLLPTSEALDDQVYLDAVALFRGHVIPRPFMVGGDLQGDVIAFERPRPGPTTVHVKGKAQQVRQLLLILDCSGSMNLAMDFEGRPSTRFKVARDRILTIIRRLPAENYRVGLMLIGNRAGWSSTDSEKVVRKDDTVDPRLHPGDDVATPLSIRGMIYRDNAGRLVDYRDRMQEVLDSASPWGETPLYYALTQALQEFDRSQPAPCHVIVVTDGVDEQSSDARHPTGWKDVTALLSKPPYADTRIDIIEFGRSDQEKQETIEKREDLKRIARDPHSGGDFYEASDPSALLKILESSIERVKYYVAAMSTAARPPSSPVDLGATWTVPQPARPTQYAVRLVGAADPIEAEVELFGGESLEMEYDLSTQRLEHHRYEDALRDSAENLIDPIRNERRLFIGTHMAGRNGNRVSVFVSVQNNKPYLFSRRPRHIWCEIRPKLANPVSRPPTYLAYDLAFVPNRPVPLLQFDIPQWPAGASTAELQMWVHLDDDVEPNHVVDVTSAEVKTHRYADLPNVNFRIEPRPGTQDEPYRLVVVEQHQAGTELMTVRVQAAPEADRIVHSYIAAANQVRHVFFYDDRAVIVRQTPQIEFTSQQRLKQNAVFSGPLEITVPPH